MEVRPASAGEVCGGSSHTTLKRYGEPDPFFRHLVSLRGCDPIPGVTVETFLTEREVLLCWKRMVANTHDVDIILGWNIYKFDFEFMVKRAERFGILKDFGLVGRMRHEPCSIRKKELSSAQYGHNEFQFMEVVGRVQVDLLPVIQREKKLASYKLEAVASKFLGEHKLDLPPKEIFDKYENGGDAAKRPLSKRGGWKKAWSRALRHVIRRAGA